MQEAIAQGPGPNGACKARHLARERRPAKRGWNWRADRPGSQAARACGCGLCSVRPEPKPCVTRIHDPRWAQPRGHGGKRPRKAGATWRLLKIKLGGTGEPQSAAAGDRERIAAVRRGRPPNPS